MNDLDQVWSDIQSKPHFSFQETMGKSRSFLRDIPLEYSQLLLQCIFLFQTELAMVSMPKANFVSMSSVLDIDRKNLDEISVAHLNLASITSNMSWVAREIDWLKENYPIVFLV